jgi:3-methyladenine DNA glycosylase/8-oxoguanine DNA glycosylase
MKLLKNTRFTLDIPDPFDFSLTVAKPAGWHWSIRNEIFKDRNLWTGIYLGGTPVGLKMSARKNTVSVTAFSESPLPVRDTEELASIVAEGLGAGEDLKGFYEFAQQDPVLSKTVEDLRGMHLGRVDDLFGGTILAILLQMAPMKRSEEMMDAVLGLYGTPVEFDYKSVTLWPTPEKIAGIPESDLRSLAKLGYRSGRLIAAARYIADHPMSLRELAKLPGNEALKKLTSIPGVGAYSAGIILWEASLPVDTWSVTILSELYFGETPANPREAIDRVAASLTERFGKWSWFAFGYILNDLGELAKIYKLSRIT